MLQVPGDLSHARICNCQSAICLMILSLATHVAVFWGVSWKACKAESCDFVQRSLVALATTEIPTAPGDGMVVGCRLPAY